jgi:hypothetical protein
MNSEFLKPRLTGPRFDQHGIPLEFLRDFAALEEMIVEVAKWKYRQENPQRERIPRGFANHLEFVLSIVDEGIAIPVILMASALQFQQANARYFEQARDDIIESIALAQCGAIQSLPPSLLSIFDRFGRSLREGEAIEFERSGASKATLTPDVRRKLIRAAQVDDWTEEVTLYGKITEADQARNSFELELKDGSRVKAPLCSQHLETVMAAFTQYRNGTAVTLRGVAKKDRHDRLKSIDAVEHISLLDPLDVTLRLDALSLLQDGWLDGKGKAPSRKGLQWFASEFDSRFDSMLPLPHLYPTPEGGIQAEWTLSGWEITLAVDLQDKQAVFQCLHLSDETQKDITLNLAPDGDWQRLNQTLQQIEGAVA